MRASIIVLLTFCFFLTACDEGPSQEGAATDSSNSSAAVTQTSSDASDNDDATFTANMEHVIAGPDVLDPMGFILKHVGFAQQKGLRPFVYFTAVWCGPCHELADAMGDQRMQEAFDGTYIIELDYDRFGKFAAQNYGAYAIPAWSGLNMDGTSNENIITGGEWEENIPQNMAPVLHPYFRGEYNK